MLKKLIAVGLAICAASSLAIANEAAVPAAVSEAYAPMAPVAPMVGKTWRGSWTDDSGKEIVDLSQAEFILGGRALQTTHRIEGGDYGGRTIFFYDEAAKKYVYHYFTTAGFHTMGEATIENGVMTTTEDVAGHATVAQVRGVMRFSGDEMKVDVVYVGKDGSETPAPTRTYRPLHGAVAAPLFPPTEQ